MEKYDAIVAKATFALVIYVLALSTIGSVMSVMHTNETISNVGSVKAVGVGVYWDSACSNAVSSINWGMLNPGSSKNETIFIRNEGNTTVTLTMTTSNWNPPNASDYLTLNWNYNGQALEVGEVIQVTLTLSVSSSIDGITSFSFDITLTASES